MQQSTHPPEGTKAPRASLKPVVGEVSGRLTVRHQVGLEEGIELAVEHRIGVTRFDAGTHILDQLVGVQHVVAYLGSPLDFLFACFDLAPLGVALFDDLLVQPRLEELNGLLFVLKLRTRLGILDHDARRLVAQSNARFDLVDVLATGSARAKGVPINVGHVDLNVDGVVDQRVHVHAHKRGMAARVRVKRTDAHQAVDPVLAFEVAKYVLTFNLERHGLDSSDVALLKVQLADFVPVALGPAQVHAHQHSGPVAGLGSARTRRHLQYGAHFVFFAAKHIAELHGAELLLELRCGGIHFVFFEETLTKEIDRRLDLAHLRLNGLIALNPVLQFADFAHGLLRLLGVVPKARIARFFFFVRGSNALFFEAQVTFEVDNASLVLLNFFGRNHGCKSTPPTTFEPMKPMTADFRSDTVTRPTEGMLRAMAAAPVGDDVLGDDPTVQRLESVLAERFGIEAGLFCPSGTMTNQIAVNVHTRPGDELICSKLAHVYNYEGGGLAFNSGVQVRVGGDNYGRLSATDAEALLQPMDNVHAAPTRLVVAENTSNKGGGTTLGIQSLRELGAFARQHNLGYHLDGARLFNALVADREQPEDYGRLFDSISICLSKGLGAPVGSVLLGSADFIREGRRIRKRFGGGMRQAGYLAAAGLYALDHHVNRLAEDHARAASLATYMAQLPYVAEIKPAATNMVLFRLQDGFNGSELLTHLSALGIQLIAMDRHWLRAVLHYDVGDAEVQRLSDGLASWAI